MKRLLILGATGLVGQQVLAQALADPSMDNLAAIVDAATNWLKVTFDLRVVELA